MNNLKHSYPLPLRMVIRESFWWIVIGAALAALLLLFNYTEAHFSGFINIQEVAFKKAALLLGVVLVLLGRISYGLVYRATYSYSINRGRLTIGRGILFREEASLALIPLTEIYIKRSWIDMLFGLSNVYIAVVLERSQKIGEIRGLRKEHAQRIRDLILDEIESSQFKTASVKQKQLPNFSKIRGVKDKRGELLGADFTVASKLKTRKGFTCIKGAQ